MLNFATRFPDESACHAFLVQRRWPDGLACLNCGSIAVYICKTRQMFKCKDCYKQFSARVNTIFQDSHLPLRKWFLAVHLLTAKGMSSYDLQKQISVTQKTAWFLTQRIRAAMEEDDIVLSGIVQIDETYVGPKSKGRSSARYSKKYAIMGAVEEGEFGRVKLQVVKQPDATVAAGFIRENVELGSALRTDESRIYNAVRYNFEHSTVNHSQHQYVDAGVTTNKIENAWMHTKRLLRGTYIRVTGKHLQLYAHEFQFRYNNRHKNGNDRFDQWFSQAWGRVLTYKQLRERRATQPLAPRGWARKRALMPVQMRLF